MKAHFVLFILMLAWVQLIAQKQYNVWHTGAWDSGSGIRQPAPGVDFNSTTPVADTNSNMSFTEGSTVLCDKNGNLLFYTDGDTIWNANHDVLLNGSAMANGAGNVFTTTQNAIAIPYTDTNYYGLVINDGLTSGNGTGLFYSVIDRKLDGGLGGVNNVKDIPILSNTHEKLVAIRHANGCDFWIITVVQNNYYAFLFTTPPDYTDTDLSCTIIDTVITVAPGPYDIGGAMNRIKVSPKNNQIALKTGQSGSLYTLDFDNATGVFSNPFMLADLAGIGSNSQKTMHAYSYSTNGDYLYVVTDSLLPAFTFSGEIYQFDMTVAQAIQPSTMQFLGKTIDSIIGSTASLQGSGDIQIGPDGKLYLSYYNFGLGTGENNSFLTAIENPNTATPSIVDAAIYLGGRRTWHTLPNLITDYLLDTLPSPCSFPLTAGFITDSSCFPSAVSFYDGSIGEPTQWEWNFGDPASGPANTSTLQNPSHSYSSAGTFNAELIVYRGCRTDTVNQTINTSIDGCFAISNDTSVCLGDSVLLTASGSTTGYNWADSLTFSPILSTDSFYMTTPVTTTTYGVYNATDTLYATVTVILPGNAGITNTIDLCSNGSPVNLLDSLGGSPDTGGVWAPALAGGIFDPGTNTGGVYTYTVLGSGGCPNADADLIVNVNTAPSVNLGSTTSFCQGDSLLLDAGNAGSTYTWTPAGTSQTIYVSVPGTYSVDVTDSLGCIGSGSIVVTEATVPSVNLGSATSFCQGDSLLLDAGNIGSTYAWTPSGTTQTIYVSAPGTYSVDVTDPLGCIGSGSITVTETMPPSVIIDGNTTLCAGEATQLTSATGFVTWSTTQFEDTITIVPAGSGWYWAIDTNSCGSSTDSLFVTVNPLPTVSAGNDTTVMPFAAFSLSGSGGTSYVWSPATGLSCTQCQNPTVSVSADATYCVTVTDSNGCMNTDCIDIIIDVSGEVWAANIFSPNGDGLNDVFYIRGPIQDDQFLLIIYNRWGELVFETYDPKMGWDGTHNGKSLNPAVFAFVTSGISQKGNEFELKGNLTLLSK